MAKKPHEVKHDSKRTHTDPTKTSSSEKTHVTTEKALAPVKSRVIPAKAHARARKEPPDGKPIPSMTEEQTQAYQKFSEACKEAYEKFSKEKIDTRVTQLKSSSALVAVVRFMVMTHDLLRMYGVMQFNKHVSPSLYKSLDDIQEQTGQKLPLARILLDGIKATKMELLSGVTVHPLPNFKEPEYKTMAAKTPAPVDPIDEEFEQQDPVGDPPPDQPGIGPGGPYFDPTVPPQSGTPVDDPVNPPDSIHELPDEGEELPPEE